MVSTAVLDPSPAGGLPTTAHLSLLQSLTCLVQLASVRRSLFTNTERGTFLMQLVKGVRSILEQPQVVESHWWVLSLPHTLCPPPQALADSECYHEFCRLLMRLKSNYQLGELMRLDDYPRIIELIAKFTISSLQVSRTRDVDWR